MAPIPHVQKIRTSGTPSVASASSSTDMEALLRKIRRQKRELKAYTDAAVEVVSNDLEDMGRNVSTIKDNVGKQGQTIQGYETQVREINQKYSKILDDVEDLRQKIDDIEEPTLQPSHPILDPSEP